jgi:hypothetical protein
MAINANGSCRFIAGRFYCQNGYRHDIAKIKGRCPVVNENTNENLCIMKVPAIANKTN